MQMLAQWKQFTDNILAFHNVSVTGIESGFSKKYYYINNNFHFHSENGIEGLRLSLVVQLHAVQMMQLFDFRQMWWLMFI